MTSQQLSDKTLHKLNDVIMAIDPEKDIERDPKLHIGLNPLFLTMRQELHSLQELNKISRKCKLRTLLIEDYLCEEKELRQVEFAYMNTQK